MNILDIIQNSSKKFPDKLAYAKVGKHGIEKKITYEELENKIEMAVSYLKGIGHDGEKIIIMLPSCIEYIIMFFASLFCKNIAIPAYPVTNSHHKERLKAILKNSEAQIIITDTITKDKMYKNFEELCNGVLILDTDEILADRNRIEKNIPIEILDEDIAYLQYTSGSTKDAKGVIITHKNIISNETVIKESLGLNENERIICWLPFYHDMGLIGNLILTVFLGASCYFMSPVDFIQKPALWLRVISDYGGTLITAPNFAYQMCVDEIMDDELENLQLNTLRNAINGAEPVRKITLEKFVEKFSKFGFITQALKPSYGLAENTLLATTYSQDSKFNYKILNKDRLSQNIIEYDENGIEIVSSGKILSNTDIKIIDLSLTEFKEDKKIGEICISSDSASKGYWNQTNENNCFGIKIGNDNKNYFKTGDLGFIDDEYLYIVGRMKDIIIIRGKNYYPQDIELVVEDSDSYLKKDSSAAFSIIMEEEERLVIVCEIEKHLRPMKNEQFEISEEKNRRKNEIMQDIYKNIITEFNIEPFDIILIQEKSIPKTSSGKIQRQLCKKQYQDNELKIWCQMRK